MNNFKYETVDIVLRPNTTIATAKANLSSYNGKAVAFGVITKGNDSNRIINLAVKKGGSEVVRPISVDFLQKTAGGDFLNAFAPIELESYDYNVEITTATPVNEEVSTQIVFIIDENNN